MRDRSRSVSDIAIIALFLACLYLPVGGSLLRFDPSPAPGEKRALARLPRLERDTLSDFPAQYEEYYNDHFGFRNSLIRWHNLVKLRWLRTSPSSNVILGRDGFLFYGDENTVDYVRAADPFEADELDLWRTVLKERSAWLGERDIKFLTVVAPNKHTMCERHLPRWMNRVERESRLDQLVDHVRREPDVAFLDLREALRHAARTRPIFRRTDTHWNQYGAFVGYRRIMAELSPWFRDLGPPTDSAFTLVTEQGPGGDLARMLALGDILREDRVVIRPTVPRSARRVSADEGLWQFVSSDGPAPLITERDGDGLPRAVIFRDSAANVLIPFFSEHFERAVFLRHFDTAVIDLEKPDLVIWEFKERRLQSLKTLRVPTTTRRNRQSGADAESPPADRPGLYHPSEQLFLLLQGHAIGNALVSVDGRLPASSIPIAGDWSACGRDSPGIYDPESGKFYLYHQDRGSVDITFRFGPRGAGWLPVAGDWDGDGADSVGLYDAASGRFHLTSRPGEGGTNVSFALGEKQAGWVPVSGDWDGDGKDTVGLYDPESGIFRLSDRLRPGKAELIFRFGLRGADRIPIAGDWDADGRDSVGLYEPGANRFHLRNELTKGKASLTIRAGRRGRGLRPLAGCWRPGRSVSPGIT